MIARVYNPNPYYYDKNGGIRYEGSNAALTELGARNRLPCGGHWIIGGDFAFCIEYGADSYSSPFTCVREFGARTTEKWAEMRVHLCEIERNWHTPKTRNEVAQDLGLDQQSL